MGNFAKKGSVFPLDDAMKASPSAAGRAGAGATFTRTIPAWPGRAARRKLFARRPSRIAYRGRIDCNKFEASVAPTWQPMFERSDNVMPVAAESAVIAVV